MANERVTIEFVVSGQPYSDEFSTSQPLKSVVQKVLAQTDHTGQQAENWIVTEDGDTLDLDKSLAELGIGEDAQLKLNPRSGRGG